MTPIVGLQREASANTSIGRYRVAKGEKVWINVMALHHDPAHWPQPEVGFWGHAFISMLRRSQHLAIQSSSHSCSKSADNCKPSTTANTWVLVCVAEGQLLSCLCSPPV